jgi:hypothetical protein
MMASSEDSTIAARWRRDALSSRYCSSSRSRSAIRRRKLCDSARVPASMGRTNSIQLCSRRPVASEITLHLSIRDTPTRKQVKQWQSTHFCRGGTDNWVSSEIETVAAATSSNRTKPTAGGDGRSPLHIEKRDSRRVATCSRNYDRRWHFRNGTRSTTTG